MRSAPDRFASRKSAPIRSARRRSAPVRSAAIRYAPRRSAPRRSAPLSLAPMRSAPRWSRFFLRGAVARTSSLVRSSSSATTSRWPATSRSENASAGRWVRRSVSSRVRRISAWRGRAGSRDSDSVRYQRSSWSCRMTGNTWNICPAICGARRQSCPSKVSPETFWPAPKQSYTVQPGKPCVRSSVWMPQRKSSWRFRQGFPASLSIAKSADRVRVSATQHSPKQFAQSARSAARSPRSMAGPWTLSGTVRGSSGYGTVGRSTLSGSITRSRQFHDQRIPGAPRRARALHAMMVGSTSL